MGKGGARTKQLLLSDGARDALRLLQVQGADSNEADGRVAAFELMEGLNAGVLEGGRSKKYKTPLELLSLVRAIAWLNTAQKSSVSGKCFNLFSCNFFVNAALGEHAPFYKTLHTCVEKRARYKSGTVI